MKQFQFGLTTKIYFGEDITKEALVREKHLLKGTVLLVTGGGSVKKYGYLNRLIEIIGEINENVEIVLYDKVSPNPRLEEAEEAIRLGKEKRAGLVIGFGGGSAMDAAKAAAVGIPEEEGIEAYLLEGKTPTEKTLPIIAIPTTAGTGSELSKGAILTSKRHGVKNGIRGEYILPKAAIVDPVYTWTVPRNITMETGFDVLAHAIEGYVAVKSNYFSEMLSEQAVEIVGEYLPRLNINPDDKEAREKMCFASMIMGMNLANVGTCLPHRVQYAIGAKTDTSHAAGLLALYPAWMKYEFEVNKDKIAKVMKILGFGEVCDGQQAKESIEQFISGLQVGKRLSGLGITGMEIEEMAEAVTGNLANDSLSEKPEIIKTILEESI